MPSSSQRQISPGKRCPSLLLGIGQQPRRTKARCLGSLRNSEPLPAHPQRVAFFKQNVAPASRRHNAPRKMPPLRAGVKTGTLSVQVDLPNPPPRRQRGQYTGPRAQSTASNRAASPPCNAPLARARPPRVTEKETEARRRRDSSKVRHSRRAAGPELALGVRVTTAAGTPPEPRPRGEAAAALP